MAGVRALGASRATLALALAAALLAGALGWHGLAHAEYRASLAAGIPLETRFVHAYTSAALVPWSTTYQARRRRVEAWIRADALLAAGDYKDATALLSATLGRTPAEPDLVELYRLAQETETAETNRKAHLQHGHEGPGGTLDSKDLER